MKILLFSDLHSQNECLEKIKRLIKLEQPDYAICCGDICQGDDLNYFTALVKILKSLKDAFIITGNNDGQLVKKALFDSNFSSHLRLRKLLNYKIFGISDGEIEKSINSEDISGAILLTHRPPNKNQLQQNLKNAPKYHISGHLHSKFGMFKYPATTHIQIPSLISGQFGLSMYGIFDPDTNKVEFKKID